MTAQTFGQWIRERRKQRGLTQKGLGKLVGYAEITVRQLEHDTYTLTRFIVERFVSCLALEGDDSEAIIRFAVRQLPVPAVSSSASALYRQGTPFIGRETELEQIQNLLRNPACRCISIVGLGGVGKTRLAVQVIATEAGDVSREVAFVSLAEATTTEQMARNIAEAVGIALSPFGTSVNQILQALAARPMLLVLDNFEQLLPNGAVFIAELLELSSAVQIIITSRERLQISSEWSIQLQGLGMNYDSPLADAVQLFVSTAKRLNHRFVPSEQAAIEAICGLLQGIPLAIEMAASWTDIHTCSEILRGVTDKVLDLTSRHRDISDRHKSLQAVFEATWERLSRLEQVALSRLAVFHGGFTLTAARKVTETDEKVLIFLQEKMLIHSQGDGRLALHEMIRQLALHKLMLDEPAWTDARTSHAEYYMHLLSSSANRMKYSFAREEVLRIRTELDNIRAAQEILLAERRTDWFEMSWESIWLFFNITSRFREGESWFRSIADAFSSAEFKKKGTDISAFSSILVAGYLLRQGRVPEALTCILAPHVTPIGESEIPLEQHFFHFLKSYVMHAVGDSDGAFKSLEKGLKALHLMEHDAYYRVTAYFQAGRVQHLIGNYETGHQFLIDSLRLHREHRLGWGKGLILTELGLIAEAMGKVSDALAYYEAVLAAVSEWEEVWNYFRTQINIGRVKLTLGQVHEAAAIFYATLQSLRNDPQIGLEIDCFVEIALVLKQFDAAPLAVVLLEYCSVHPECFQPIRNRATHCLKTFKAEMPTLDTTASRNLFPDLKSEVVTLLLDQLDHIRQSWLRIPT